MTAPMDFPRTRLDENMDERWAILAASGVTLEMAMAKLLEMRVQDSLAYETEADD